MRVFLPDLTFPDAAARSEIHPGQWRQPFLRLLDGIEAGWAVPLLLGGFVVVWTAFLVIAYSVGDLHADVLEAWTFGRSFEWGSAKHPPLMGWIARAWTSVFPLTDWSFQLLALVNSATALWFVDLISRRFVKGDKRIIVLLLLMLRHARRRGRTSAGERAPQVSPWAIAHSGGFEAPVPEAAQPELPGDSAPGGADMSTDAGGGEPASGRPPTTSSSGSSASYSYQ